MQGLYKSAAPTGALHLPIRGKSFCVAKLDASHEDCNPCFFNGVSAGEKANCLQAHPKQQPAGGMTPSKKLHFRRKLRVSFGQAACSGAKNGAERGKTEKDTMYIHNGIGNTRSKTFQRAAWMRNPEETLPERDGGIENTSQVRLHAPFALCWATLELPATVRLAPEQMALNLTLRP